MYLREKVWKKQLMDQFRVIDMWDKGKDRLFLYMLELEIV